MTKILKTMKILKTTMMKTMKMIKSQLHKKQNHKVDKTSPNKENLNIKESLKDKDKVKIKTSPKINNKTDQTKVKVITRIKDNTKTKDTKEATKEVTKEENTITLTSITMEAIRISIKVVILINKEENLSENIDKCDNCLFKLTPFLIL